MNMLYDNELVIDELTPEEAHEAPDGQMTGLIPRDYESLPRGVYASVAAVDIPTIDQSEWSERCADMVGNQARLSDVRMRGKFGGMIPSLDQNGKGYCWAHSSTMATIMLRAIANEPYVSLSAYAIACIIKDFRDEGGWGALSLDFITQRGVPDEKYWPQRSMSRANDNPQTWKNAAFHKVTEGWIDLAAAVYDRKLSFAQEATCYLSGFPVVKDENWWGHSICGLDLVDGNALKDTYRAESGKLMEAAEFAKRWGMDDPVTGGFGVRIINSWGDSWSDNGMGVLTGSKAVSDGAVAPRVTSASAE